LLEFKECICHNRWSDEEIRIIKEKYNTIGPNGLLSSFKGRTYFSLEKKARRLGLFAPKPYINVDFFRDPSIRLYYVLGLIATDGCIGMSSKSFVYELNEYLTEILILSRHTINIYVVEGNSPSYKISLTGNNARKLCRWMYHDKMSDAYLARKYDVWLRHEKRKYL
jgi:hypothetical protein